MSKLTVYENVRVVCDVEWPPYIKDQARAFQSAKTDAEAIADQIRRHVDGCGPRDHSRPGVVWDTRYECSHCGGAWEDDPGCCNTATVEWRDAQDDKEGKP